MKLLFRDHLADEIIEEAIAILVFRGWIEIVRDARRKAAKI